MSERTAASLERLDTLLPLIRQMAPSSDQARLVDETEALRRAVAAFHMEAIRFRMHAVDRFLKIMNAEPAALEAFTQVRQALEAAGFYTRSHAEPGKG